MISRLLDWLLSRESTSPRSSAGETDKTGGSASNSETTYSSDQPILRRDEDRFNRWPFAARIAETIAKQTDPSSIIVGVYGPWGDGKTSTLALMEVAWTQAPNIIPVRFNCWQFGSEEQLLRAFFDTLADALGKSLTNRKEDIGKILKKYGSILSIASFDVAHSVKLDPGKGVVALGDALSTVELDTLRSRLEQILIDSGKRAVVLVDDIDRLDRSEIHSLFRLIKVSVSFKNISYVLAFDDEMVAAALGERYGEGGPKAGRNFLEKIVSVPLHLPPAETIELRKIAFEGIDAVLQQQAISLSREEIERFQQMFIDAISPQLTTPRQAKRFANAISFAVPILRGEANTVDLLIVEAIRIFFPRLYATIRDNPSLFLGSSSDRTDTDRRVTQLRALVDPALDDAGIVNKDTIYRRLTEPLFPRSGRIGHGSDWDTKWSNEQRICSAEYFSRYFSYSVPPGDIGDVEVQQFVEKICTANVNEEQIGAQLKRFAERRAIPGLLTKLRYREDAMEAVPALRMALAIAPHGSLLPKEEGPWVFRTTRMQGAILIRKLLQRLPMSERVGAAVEIIKKAEPLPFAADVLRWMQQFKDGGEAERVIEPASEVIVALQVVERIREAASLAPLYAAFGDEAPLLLWTWKQYGLKDQMETDLMSRLRESDGATDDFLAMFGGRSWGIESGISRRSEFSRSQYDSVANLIDPEFIVERLTAKYGEGLQGAREVAPNTDAEWARQTAAQFVSIHKFVMGERQPPSDQPAGQE